MPSILLVEDDSAIVESLGAYLRAEDFEVTAADGQRRVEALLDEQRFDLLLVDMSLRDGDGFGVCAAAKARALPVIFLTASADEGSVVTGLDMGAEDYITKPFRPRAFVAHPPRAAAKRQSRRPRPAAAVDGGPGQGACHEGGPGAPALGA